MSVYYLFGCRCLLGLYGRVVSILHHCKMATSPTPTATSHATTPSPTGSSSPSGVGVRKDSDGISFVIATPSHLPSDSSSSDKTTTNNWILESAAECLALSFAMENQNICCGVTSSQWMPYARQYLTNRFKESLSMLAVYVPKPSVASTTRPQVVGVLCGEDLSRVTDEGKEYVASGTYLQEWQPIEAIIDELMPSYHKLYGSLSHRDDPPAPPSPSITPAVTPSPLPPHAVTATATAAVPSETKTGTPPNNDNNESQQSFHSGVHWYISLLAVHPSYHGRGIGGRLISEAMTHIGRGRGFLRAMTMASSHASQSMFTKAGFTEPHASIKYTDWVHTKDGKRTFESINDGTHFTVVSYDLTAPTDTNNNNPATTASASSMTTPPK
jgi:hypothetical protein